MPLCRFVPFEPYEGHLWHGNYLDNTDASKCTQHVGVNQVPVKFIKLEFSSRKDLLRIPNHSTNTLSVLLSSMSEAHCFSPILRLNSDVILRIISMNSNMFSDDNALTDTRYALQVCSTWCATMLEDSKLWTRLIDFDTLHALRSDDWALELIRRSQTAPLWIKGEKLHSEVDRNSYRSLKSYCFLIAVIDVHWERIRRLVLMSRALVYVNTAFCPIYRPAPLLDTFHIQFEHPVLAEHFSTMHRFMDLFNGSAPMIRHFSAYHQKLNYNASWWHNLRSLDFGGVDNICEILAVLSAIPNLEYLKARSSEEAVPLLPRSAVFFRS